MGRTYSHWFASPAVRTIIYFFEACMFTAAITFACIPTEVSRPVYYTDNRGNLEYYNDWDYIYPNLPLCVFVCVAVFFIWLITMTAACQTGVSCCQEKKNRAAAQYEERQVLVQNSNMNYQQQMHQPPMMNYQQPQFGQQMPVSVVIQ